MLSEPIAIWNSLALATAATAISGIVGFRIARDLARGNVAGWYGLLLLAPVILGDLATHLLVAKYSLSTIGVRAGVTEWAILLLSSCYTGSALVAVFVWLRLRMVEPVRLEFADAYRLNSGQLTRVIELPSAKGQLVATCILVFVDNMNRTFGAVSGMRLSRGTSVHLLSVELDLLQQEYVTANPSTWTDQLRPAGLLTTAASVAIGGLVAVGVYHLCHLLHASGKATDRGGPGKQPRGSLSYGMSLSVPVLSCLPLVLSMIGAIGQSLSYSRVQGPTALLSADVVILVWSILLAAATGLTLVFTLGAILGLWRFLAPGSWPTSLSSNRRKWLLLGCCATIALSLNPVLIKTTVFNLSARGPDLVWIIGEMLLWALPTLFFVALLFLRTPIGDVEWATSTQVRKLSAIRDLFLLRHRSGLLAVALLIAVAMAFDIGIAEASPGFTSLAESVVESTRGRMARPGDLAILFLVVSLLVAIPISILGSLLRVQKGRI